jgi:hypothetical protein
MFTVFGFEISPPLVCSFAAGFGYVMGYIYATIRKPKVRFDVNYIPEDFSEILYRHGMPRSYTVEQSKEFLDKRLGRWYIDNID